MATTDGDHRGASGAPERPPKADERVSYNRHFLLWGLAFAAVTAWAVWDETASRREYKVFQRQFFDLDAKLTEKAWREALATLEGSAEWKALGAEIARLEAELAGPAGDRLRQAKARLAAAEVEAFDRAQTATFTKSRLDEAYYELTRSRRLALGDEAARQAEHDRLAARLEVDHAAAERAAAEVDRLKAESCGLTRRLDEARGKREAMLRPIADLERRHRAAAERRGGWTGPATEIVQQNLERLGRVDRCESCHLGVNRGGLERVDARQFRSHPLRRTLLGLHPVERFGCTLCHDGQGRATTRFHAHAPSESTHDFETHFWEEPLLRGPFQQSLCRQCHRQQVELRAPLRCESDAECPEGLKCAALALPLNPVAALPSSIEARIEPGRFCGTASFNDPDKVDPRLVELAPSLARGRRLMEEMGCPNCHVIDGLEGRPKPGPDLRRAAAKLGSGWMVEWLLEPKAFRPASRMPTPFPEPLHPRDYKPKAMPDYVDGLALLGRIRESDEARRRAAIEALPVHRFQPRQQAALVAAYLLGASAPFPTDGRPGDAERGEQLVDSLGCYGCHGMSTPTETVAFPKHNRAAQFEHGPNLGNIGAKTTAAWIRTWILDPKAYAPATRMPSLRLAPDEAGDIAAFLSGNRFVGGQRRDYPPSPLADPRAEDQRRLGRKLVNYYGCYVCHTVDGFEQTPGIGPELSEFGVKETTNLDFGEHITDHASQTWSLWLASKLKHPRVYRSERIDMRMSQFDFSPEEIHDLMVVLKGLRGRPKAAEVAGHVLDATEQGRERGREMVRRLNCWGCHTIDRHDGDIRQLDAYQGTDATGGARSRLAPPVLDGEGGKAQPAWLFGYLRQPSTLRPSLAARMPTFGFSDDEAATLTQMFSAIDGADYPLRDYTVPPLDERRRQMGESAFRAAQCTQCHSLGGPPTTKEQADIGAPDLVLTKTRLRGDWLLRWLRDPQVLQPGVNMPTFFGDGNPLQLAGEAPMTRGLPRIADVARLDTDETIRLLRDYQMRLEAPAAKAR